MTRSVTLAIGSAVLMAACSRSVEMPVFYRDPEASLEHATATTYQPEAITQWWLEDNIDAPLEDVRMVARVEDTRTSPLLRLIRNGVPVGEEDVIRLTLMHNLQIQISNTDRERAVANVAARKGQVYDLLLRASVSEDGGEELSFGEVPGGFLSTFGTAGAFGGEEAGGRNPVSITDRQLRQGRVSASQRIPTGATIETFYEEQKSDIDSQPLSGTNPFTETAAGITLTQPLLRGLGPTVTNAPITIAKIDRSIGEHEFRNQINEQLAQVLRTYYNLIFALETASVQRVTLLQALDFEAINRIRLRVGDVAQVDVEQATAQVARQEEEYLVSIQNVLDRQDELRRLMNLRQESGLGWDTPLLPMTVPTFADVEVDESELLETALLHRSDWQQALLRIERSNVELRVANNDLLPRLDAFATYRYVGENGSGNRARDLTRGGEFEQYVAGLEFEYPLQNREARYDRYRTRLATEAAELRLADLALVIRQEIRRNVRALETARKRIDVNRAGIRAEQEKFNSERKRYEVGLATSFELLDALDDLNNAKIAYLQSVIDYRTALIDLKLSQGNLINELGITIGAESSLVTPGTSYLAEDEAPPAAAEEIDPVEGMIPQRIAEEEREGRVSVQELYEASIGETAEERIGTGAYLEAGELMEVEPEGEPGIVPPPSEPLE